MKKFYIIFFMFLIFLILPINTYAAASPEPTEATKSWGSTKDGDKGDGLYLKAKEEVGDKSSKINSGLNNLYKYVRYLVSVIVVFGTITSFLTFGVSLTRLAIIPSHPIERRKVYMDILKSGIATFLLGSLSLVMTIFYDTFASLFSSTKMLSFKYNEAIQQALVEYKYFIVGINGILAMTCMIVFIKDAIVLASSGGNPHKRSEAMHGLFTTIIGIAGFGGLGILVAIFIHA